MCGMDDSVEAREDIEAWSTDLEVVEYTDSGLAMLSTLITGTDPLLEDVGGFMDTLDGPSTIVA